MLFLSVYVDDIRNDWKKSEYGSHVEEIDEICRSWRTYFISSPREKRNVLNVNANRRTLFLMSRGPTTWKDMRQQDTAFVQSFHSLQG